MELRKCPSLLWERYCRKNKKKTTLIKFNRIHLWWVSKPSHHGIWDDKFIWYMIEVRNGHPNCIFGVFEISRSQFKQLKKFQTNHSRCTRPFGENFKFWPSSLKLCIWAWLFREQHYFYRFWSLEFFRKLIKLPIMRHKLSN